MRKSASGFWILCPISLCMLLGALTSAVLRAQTESFRFKHLTVDDGLSQNLVYKILQDRKGYVVRH